MSPTRRTSHSSRGFLGQGPVHRPSLSLGGGAEGPQSGRAEPAASGSPIGVQTSISGETRGVPMGGSHLLTRTLSDESGTHRLGRPTSADPANTLWLHPASSPRRRSLPSEPAQLRLVSADVVTGSNQPLEGLSRATWPLFPHEGGGSLVLIPGSRRTWTNTPGLWGVPVEESCPRHSQ